MHLRNTRLHGSVLYNAAWRLLAPCHLCVVQAQCVQHASADCSSLVALLYLLEQLQQQLRLLEQVLEW